MDSRRIAGQLAEPERLRVVAALALGARTLPDVAHRAGLELPTAGQAIRRLEKAGLVARTHDGYELLVERFKEAARAEQPEPEALEVSDPAMEPTLRAFVKGGRLTHLPTAWHKQLVVLRWLADRFEPGVHYAEPEVNAVLLEVYPDYALLRRTMVDAGLLSREAGIYWRSGGYVDVLADDASD